MAKLILTLKEDELGEQELLVDLESDPGALNFEHESDHKKIIKKLTNGSGDLDVDRPTDGTDGEAEREEETPEAQKVKN